MTVRSISFRLTAWYAGMVVAVIIVFGAISYKRLEHYLNLTLRQSMSHRAAQIANGIVSDPDRLDQDELGVDIEGVYAPGTNDRFVRVTRKDGTIIYVSGQPNDHSFDPRKVPLPSNPSAKLAIRVEAGPAPLLIASTIARVGDETYLVESGASMSPIKNVLRRFLETLIIGLTIVVCVAVSGGYVLIKRALAPVRRMTETAQEITLHHLNRRLPLVETGDEIAKLSLTLNQMISRLDESFQSVNRFTSDASHELRTPLTIIRGELESLLANERDAGTVKKTLFSLLEETERLGKIVQGLLALSRLDGGTAQMEYVCFDLGEMVATTTDQMELLAEEKAIELITEIENGVEIEGDRSRLKQVVVNLIDNAIKYTPRKGNIKVVVRSSQGKAYIEVLDSGPGIPEADLLLVFERFYRVERLDGNNVDGTGLGLSIVQSICAAHAGTVTAANREKGGSCFTVELRIAR
jgi:heavy metal sensor kinase